MTRPGGNDQTGPAWRRAHVWIALGTLAVVPALAWSMMGAHTLPSTTAPTGDYPAAPAEASGRYQTWTRSEGGQGDEWLADETVLFRTRIVDEAYDAEGRLHVAREVEYREPDDNNVALQHRHDRMDLSPLSTARIETGQAKDHPGDVLPVAPLTQRSWHLTERTYDTGSLAADTVPCGLVRHEAAIPLPVEGRADLMDPCQFHGRAVARDGFIYEGTADSPRGDLLVYRDALEPAFRVFVAPSLPYPAGFEMIDAERDDATVRTWLDGYTQIRGPAPLLPVEQPEPNPVQIQPMGIQGPSDAELNHPFPLVEAFAQLRDDPSDAHVRNYLARHPRAVVVAADIATLRHDGATTWTWRLHFSDGQTQLAACASRSQGGPTPAPPLLGNAKPPGTFLGRPDCDSSNPRIDPAALPPGAPSLADLRQRWMDVSSTTPAKADAVSWSFKYQCAPATCDEPQLVLTVGRFETQRSALPTPSASSPPVVHRPGIEDSSTLLSLADFNGEGLLLRTVEGAYSAEHGLDTTLPRGSAPDIRPQSASARPGPGPWPTLTAATIGLASLLLAAGLIWLARHLFAVGGFARLAPGDALAHPTRQTLRNLISARPGLHFHEIRRQSGTAGSPCRHHLRILVRSGLVVEVRGNARVTYFLKGKLDRRVMEALPHLQSCGARRILERIVAGPATSPAALAREAGLRRQTASEHLAKLAAAGVVELQRLERLVLVRPTELGRQAHQIAQGDVNPTQAGVPQT